MPAEHLIIGYFGKIPATGDFVAGNLPRTFIDRWDRWMSMELRARPDEGGIDPRAWRFSVCPGIFCNEPCFGVWRMSEDSAGRRYPFVIAGVGLTADSADAWFDEVTELLAGVVDDYRGVGWLAQRLAGLAKPNAPGEPHRITFWADDWEVVEFDFVDIHDLADKGLPAMRLARSDTEVS